MADTPELSDSDVFGSSPQGQLSDADVFGGEPQPKVTTPSLVKDPNGPGGFERTVMSMIPFGRDVGAVGAAAGKATHDLITGKDTNFGQDFQSFRDQDKAMVDQYIADHPILGRVAEGIGIVPGMASSGARGAATLAGRAAEGARMGALYGAGTSDGSVADRVAATGEGAVTGGVLGAAMPYVARGIGKAAGWVGDQVGSLIPPSSEEAAQTTAGKVLNKIATGQSPTFEPAPVPGMTPTAGQASNDPGILWAESAAQAKDRQALALAKQAETGNNQALRGAIGQIGDMANPEASAQMQERLAANVAPHDAHARVLADLGKTLGAHEANFYDDLDQLAQQRRAEAGPLYEKAFANTNVTSPDIARIISDPVVQSGMSKGLAIQRMEAAANGTPFNVKDFGVSGFTQATDPYTGAVMQTPVLTGVPNMRLLDATKQGLDDIVEGYRNGTTGKLDLDQYGRAVNNLRASFVSSLDSANPDYAAARSAWSGPSQSMDAMWAGRNILRPDSELTAQRIAKMPDNDLQFFRAGVMRSVQDQMEKSPDGLAAVSRVFARPDMQAKLSQAFPPNSYDGFLARTNSEMSANPIVAKVLATAPDGSYKFAPSAVADQFIRSGQGAPEAFQAYLSAAKGDPTALDAARSAFAQKFLSTVENAGLDQNGQKLLSAPKISNFVDDYGHVINSPLFTPAQRQMISNIVDGANMAARTARGAPPAGGSDTAAKLYGGKYLDALIGKWPAKALSAGGGYIAGAASGIPGGGVVGALTGAAGSDALTNALYGASKEKVVAVLNDALHDPVLAKALMSRASQGASKTMPSAASQALWARLGEITGGSAAGSSGRRQTPAAPPAQNQSPTPP